MDQPARSRRRLAHEPGVDLRRFAAELTRLPPRQGRREQVFRALFAGWCRIAAWHVRVAVHDPLPERDGVAGAGCIVVAAPHRAWLEPFLLLAAWPPDAARLVWLADAHTVTRTRWRRLVLPRLGVIPVSGSAAGPRAYAALVAAACHRGLAVAVFPEVGPPSPPQRQRPLSPGFAYLALQAGAPLVPVVMGGTHRIVRGSRFSLDRCEALAVGPPTSRAFTPEGRARARELTRQVETVVAARLPQRTAEIDALAPRRERWRWLGSLLR